MPLSFRLLSFRAAPSSSVSPLWCGRFDKRGMTIDAEALKAVAKYGGGGGGGGVPSAAAGAKTSKPNRAATAGGGGAKAESKGAR